MAVAVALDLAQSPPGVLIGPGVGIEAAVFPVQGLEIGLEPVDVFLGGEGLLLQPGDFKRQIPGGGDDSPRFAFLDDPVFLRRLQAVAGLGQVFAADQDFFFQAQDFAA